MGVFGKLGIRWGAPLGLKVKCILRVNQSYFKASGEHGDEESYEHLHDLHPPVC